MFEIVRDLSSLVHRRNTNGPTYLSGMLLSKNGSVVILLERLINLNTEKTSTRVNPGSAGQKRNIMHYRPAIQKPAAS